MHKDKFFVAYNISKERWDEIFQVPLQVVQESSSTPERKAVDKVVLRHDREVRSSPENWEEEMAYASEQASANLRDENER